jgi:hypothetical protein
MPTKKKARKKTAAKKKLSKQKALKKKVTSQRPVRKKESIRAGSAVRRNIPGPARRTSEVNSGMFRQGRRGLGPDAAGQSGDIQGLPRIEDVDSESVEELAEDGQAFESEVVSGVENARDADQGEVRTHEVSEQDIPGEYQGKREND